MEAEEYSLKDLLSHIVDNRGRTCPTAETGTALIATNCIKDDHLYPVFKNVRWVDQKTMETWFRGHPEPGDILFVLKGSPGRCCLVPDPINFCIAQDMLALRADESKVSQKFLFALLRSSIVNNAINNLHVGTMIPHFKKGDFGRLTFEIPKSRKIQEEIGNQYFILSKKIELNRKMNATLEAMAQALFKSWFVDFDPVIDNALRAGNPIPAELAGKAAIRKKILENEAPASLQYEHNDGAGAPSPAGAQSPASYHHLFPDAFQETEALGWIPAGWEVKQLDSLIQLIGGGTPKTSVVEYWNGSIPWFSVVDAPNDSDVFVIDTEKKITEAGLKDSSTRLLREGTTIISARGTVGKCALAGQKMAMNQSCYGIQGANNISDTYTYYSIRNYVADLQQRAHGSVFNTITRSTFQSITVPFGSSGLTQEFQKLMQPSLEKIKENLYQQRQLTKLRDTLLPKLISGELRIPEAEKLTEEVTA